MAEQLTSCRWRYECSSGGDYQSWAEWYI